MELATGQLLQKFGAGNHKPGSGSASAFEGMLSAQLLRTVIDLTNDAKRRKTYATHLPKLLQVQSEIESRVYPRLELLFQEDSEQFDKVIALREERDSEQDLFQKRRLSEEALSALKIATEIPLQIAELCLELGDFAKYVFDNGFKAARGDSNVALNSAISSIASCLSIVELNLTSLPADEWMEKARKRKADIKSRYQLLQPKGLESLAILERESEENMAFQQSVADFRQGNLAESLRSNSELEKMVKRLQNTLWVYRHRIWKQDSVPQTPFEVLRSEIVFNKVLGYVYQQLDTLGMHIIGNDLFEVAGLIDKDRKLVQVSTSFPETTQRFTLAHELGHVLLHKQTILHRDRPLDGSTNISKNATEIQANKFAAYFLMPASLVEEVFLEIFAMQKFVINEDTVLALRERSISQFRARCRNARGLARVLASADYFAGKSFRTLAEIFGVSVETMAIRLEELDLLEFD